MTKKLSIAIPTWECNNKGIEFLDDLLRTIEIQTFQEFEVIISDHSENDNLYIKAQEFDSKFEIKYFKNENNRGNSPSNINNALNYCEGEIVKIMFQDDFFYDDEALEKIYYTLYDSDKMWLLNGTNHTNDHGNSFYWDLYPKFNDQLLMGVNTISSPSVMSLKKGVVNRFDETLINLMDLDFYYGMWETYGDPIFYNDILVSNRVHQDSISSNIKNKEDLTKIESEYCLKKYGVSE